ncbi:MAG: dUTP diphosphatase [Desulfotomaculales bacterium]
MSAKVTGIPVKIKKHHPAAKFPVKATPESACYDVYPLEDTVIAPRGSIILGTGLAVELPPGYELQIRPRSGYAFKYNVVAYWGTLDSDYTDEIKVKLFNFGDEPQKISKDKAVAQVCVKPVYEAVFVETGELRTKGHGGFGSTDKR